MLWRKRNALAFSPFNGGLNNYTCILQTEYLKYQEQYKMRQRLSRQRERFCVVVGCGGVLRGRTVIRQAWLREGTSVLELGKPMFWVRVKSLQDNSDEAGLETLLLISTQRLSPDSHRHPVLEVMVISQNSLCAK